MIKFNKPATVEWSTPGPGAERSAAAVTLTLARTSKYFGLGDESDHVVLDGGRVVGRMMLHPQAPPERPWFWTITAPEMLPDGKLIAFAHRLSDDFGEGARG